MTSIRDYISQQVIEKGLDAEIVIAFITDRYSVTDLDQWSFADVDKVLEDCCKASHEGRKAKTNLKYSEADILGDGISFTEPVALKLEESGEKENNTLTPETDKKQKNEKKREPWRVKITQYFEMIQSKEREYLFF